MVEVTTLTRVFKFGPTTVPDPAPTLSPEDAFKLLQGALTHLAHATLEGPEVVGDQLVYTIVRPPAQTKGARRTPRATSAGQDDVEAAVKSLQAWADADSTSGYDRVLHHDCGQFLLRCRQRNARPVDPFLVGLA